jgi:hypothetical protein
MSQDQGPVSDFVILLTNWGGFDYRVRVVRKLRIQYPGARFKRP